MRQRTSTGKTGWPLAGMMTMFLALPPAVANDGKVVRISALMALMILAASQPANSDGRAIPGAAEGIGRAAKGSPYRPGVPPSATSYFQSVWGVDNFLVRSTASGNLIRFSYRVTDPARAGQLVDKSATPYMIGLRSRAVLQVPVMDKVGPLRQSTAPQAGKEAWMVFSNKGNLVKTGDRVNVIIGSFHADGLLVE